MKKGFTLAEVLITLGIIGVVAALTIPTLINDFKKKAYVNQLRAGYTILNQGFKLMMSVEGIEDYEQSELASAIESNGADTDVVASEQAAVDVLQKYFKKIQVVSRADLRGKSSCADLVGKGPRFWNLGNKNNCSGNYNMYFHLANGMSMSMFLFGKCGTVSASEDEIKSHGGKMLKNCGMIDLDVNGEKGPNQWGRDAFRFRLTQSGYVIPMKGKDDNIRSGIFDQETIKNTIITNCNPNSTSSEGWGCAARIIEVDNWKMEY